MKHILFIAVLLFSFSNISFGQQQVVDSFPYQKYPALPAFQILLLDSTSQANTFEAPKKKAIMLMFFSPDCDHCETVTQEIIAHIKDFKKTKIYMFSPMPLHTIKTFYDKMGLSNYKKYITVGQEYKGFFHSYYGTQYVPHIVIYGKDKKLVASFEGDGKIEDILNAIKSTEE